jgi:hypothetical protein
MSGRLGAALDAIGLLGPGLGGWPQARAVLRGEQAYTPQPTLIPAPTTLPAAERRRSGRVVHLALAVGQEATVDSDADLSALTTVFASSAADSNNCHEILLTLASADRQLSPTRFHNSVHNVTAGYWSIAMRDLAPYTVVCAYDGSFAAGLLEALSLVACSASAVLLVAYDVDYPTPLREKRPIGEAFAVALLLRPQAGPRSLGLLAASFTTATADRMRRDELEVLRCSAPAARALTLLERVAAEHPGASALEYQRDGSLLVEYLPCH